jgi:hypothetical protein
MNICPRSHFRRNRRAFDFALRCHGARTAVQSGVRRDRARADAERVAADIFSSTILEYSAGEHVPLTIICPRRPIVSQEANASSIIITGKAPDLGRERFFIVTRLPSLPLSLRMAVSPSLAASP